MSKKVQRQYSAELKASAVKMVIEELKTLSQVSQDLDIPLQTLHIPIQPEGTGIVIV